MEYYSQEQTADDRVVYNEQQNGFSPHCELPWPPEEENMFVLPRKITPEHVIRVQGTLKEDKKSLKMEFQSKSKQRTTLCVFIADFEKDKLSVTVGKNLYDETHNTPLDVFTRPNFTVAFRFFAKNGTPMVSLVINESDIFEFEFNDKLMSDIKFLFVDGDIQNVDQIAFEYGNK